MATSFLVVKNRAFSKLAAALTDSALTVDVTAGDGALFPSTYPFHITIDDEILAVTNRATDTLTFTRAAQSTSAAAHSSGGRIFLNITAKSITDLNTAVNTLETYDVLTTRGDIIYRAASAPARLAKGADNTILAMGANDPEWKTPATIMGDLSGQAAAAFDFNAQTVKNIAVLQTNGATAAAYSRIGGTATSQSLTSPNDLLISGELEVDGKAHLEGGLDISGLESSGAITIKPSGDADDYFTFATVSDVPSLYGTGAYLRIGDVQATQHTLNAEDDLMVSGDFEVTGTTFLDGILDISPAAAADYHLRIAGTDILNSGGQAIYINTPLETLATNGIWITLGSRVSSGDLTGIRSRATGNATSAGANVRGGYFEATMAAVSKYAAMLEGALFHADYSAGSVTVSGDVRGFTAHISQGTGLNAANLYGGLINIQTRGNETITSDDVGLMIRNEAVGGNGRQMDAAILIAEASMGGGTKGFGYGIDMNDVVIATAALRLAGDGTAVTIIGKVGEYLRIGDSAFTSHSLASEDDLMVTGKLEVNGVLYANAMELNSTFTLNNNTFDAGALNFNITTSGSGKGLNLISTFDGFFGPTLGWLHDSPSPAVNDRIGRLISQGKDSNDDTKIYGQFEFRISNVTTGGTQAGRFEMVLLDANTSHLAFTVSSTGLGWFDDGIDVDGANVDNVAIIYGNATYLRIGDAGTTAHTLNTDDDLMVTGELEVKGITYLDGALNLADNLFIAESASADGDVAAFGQFWVKNNTPNEPWYTGDDGVDHPLLGHVYPLANTYISGSGTAGSDNTAETVKTVVVPANTLTEVGDRLRVRVYFRGDTGAAVTMTATLNTVTIASQADGGGTTWFMTETWLHYIDSTHANIAETGAGAELASSAANSAGFDWTSAQDMDCDQDQVAGNHIVVYVIFLDVYPKGLI